MDSAMVGALAAIVGNIIAYAIFRNVLPTPAASQYTFEELRERYKKWDSKLNLLFVVLTVTLGFLMWEGLTVLATWHARRLPRAEITITVLRVYWGIPAFFLGMCFAMTLGLGISKWHLKDGFSDFMAYKALEQKFNYGTVLSGLQCLMILACTVLIYCGLNDYIQVTDDAISFTGWTPFRDVHRPLNTITEIRFQREYADQLPEASKQEQFTVVFSDGTKWNLDELPNELTGTELRALEDALSKGSGKAW